MTAHLGGARRHPIAVGALLVLVVLSGCALLPGSATDDPAAPTPDPTDENLSTVRSQALAAMADVDSYSVNGTVERAIGRPRESPDPQSIVDPRLVTTDTTVVVNRTTRELRAEQVQRAEGQTVEVRVWAVDETLYANSPAFQGDPDRFQDDYGSEWVVQQPSNFSARWATIDPITRQRALFAAANLTLEGVDPETGAYVLNGTVPPPTYERTVGSLTGGFSSGDFSVTSVRVTYYVDPDTGRLLRFRGEVGLVVPTDRGAVPILQTVSLSYDDYGRAVNVTVPEGAPDPSE